MAVEKQPSASSEMFVAIEDQPHASSEMFVPVMEQPGVSSEMFVAVKEQPIASSKVLVAVESPPSKFIGQKSLFQFGWQISPQKSTNPAATVTDNTKHNKVLGVVCHRRSWVCGFLRGDLPAELE